MGVLRSMFREIGILGNAKEYTYIILGRVGPTGKTYMCKRLKENGYVAFEISPNIYDLVDYVDTKNHYRIDHDNKVVTIVLNEALPSVIYNKKSTGGLRSR